MYNLGVKEQYIDHAILISESHDIETYKRGIINRFNRAESIEVDFGKDILNMSQDELMLFFSKSLKGGKDYQLNTLSMIKIYCEWGISNGISVINSSWLSELKLSDINVSQAYTDTMVSSEEELILCLTPLLDTVNRGSQDNIVRCICLLLFAGVQYDDIWHIRESDIDLDKKIILYKSKALKMSSALYEIITHNLNMDQMLVVGRNNEHSREIINEGYLISNTKEYGSERDKMKRSFTTAMSKIFAECEKSLTNTTIYDSGVFYRIMLKEKETGEVDCLEYLWARRNRSTTIDAPERVKVKCQYEYNIWKKSFNLD